MPKALRQASSADFEAPVASLESLVKRGHQVNQKDIAWLADYGYWINDIRKETDINEACSCVIGNFENILADSDINLKAFDEATGRSLYYDIGNEYVGTPESLTQLGRTCVKYARTIDETIAESLLWRLLVIERACRANTALHQYYDEHPMVRVQLSIDEIADTVDPEYEPIVYDGIRAILSAVAAKAPKVQRPATAILHMVADAVRAGDVDMLAKMLAHAKGETTKPTAYKPPPSKKRVADMTPEERKKKNDAAKIYNATYRAKQAGAPGQ